MIDSVIVSFWYCVVNKKNIGDNTVALHLNSIADVRDQEGQTIKLEQSGGVALRDGDWQEEVQYKDLVW